MISFSRKKSESISQNWTFDKNSKNLERVESSHSFMFSLQLNNGKKENMNLMTTKYKNLEDQFIKIPWSWFWGMKIFCNRIQNLGWCICMLKKFGQTLPIFLTDKMVFWVPWLVLIKDSIERFCFQKYQPKRFFGNFLNFFLFWEKFFWKKKSVLEKIDFLRLVAVFDQTWQLFTVEREIFLQRGKIWIFYFDKNLYRKYSFENVSFMRFISIILMYSQQSQMIVKINLVVFFSNPQDRKIFFLTSIFL